MTPVSNAYEQLYDSEIKQAINIRKRNENVVTTFAFIRHLPLLNSD